MQKKGINSEQTKKTNRMLVLKLLCTHQNLSRIELAKMLGLSKVTTSKIVSDFIEQGIVEEGEFLEDSRAKAGRKQVLLNFSGKSPLVIGILLSRDVCWAVLSALDLTPLITEKIKLSQGETVDSIISKLTGLVKALKSSTNRKVLGVGIAAIGPLDATAGVILSPPNFYGIGEFPVARLLEEQTGLPVFMENDMNAGALVENIFGCHKGGGNFIYFGISNGIGAGLVMNNELFTGNKGFSGEIGHMIVVDKGKKCACGNNGCLEAYINLPQIISDIQKETGIEYSGFREVCLWAEESETNKTFFQSYLDIMVTALVSLGNIFDPKLFVFGHEAVHFTENQLEYLESKLQEGLFAKNQTEIKIVPSSFGENAPLYGGAAIVLDKIFRGEHGEF